MISEQRKGFGQPIRHIKLRGTWLAPK